MVVNAEIVAAIESLPLIDHHVHGVLTADLDREAFESVITESDRSRRSGTSNFDTPVGLAIRKWCAPVLGLEEFASADDYVARRQHLGAAEVNERLLRAANLHALLIDTGFAAGGLLDVASMARAANAPAWEIVRLEAVAEDVVRRGTSASDFSTGVRRALSAAMAGGAVGTKSIAAYRYGLDVPSARPSEEAIEQAAAQWLDEVSATQSIRIEHPVLLSFLLWCGVDVATPLQIHVGYGDSDIDLVRANPALLTDFIKASEPSETPIMLLHCYPYHREAQYLAQIYPNVFFDIGEGINYAGAQSAQLIRESFEIAPFAKQLYSSDGWGPAELHFLGARLWRKGTAEVLSSWVEEGACSLEDAVRVATMVGRDNARSVYNIAQ